MPTSTTPPALLDRLAELEDRGWRRTDRVEREARVAEFARDLGAALEASDGWREALGLEVTSPLPGGAGLRRRIVRAARAPDVAGVRGPRALPPVTVLAFDSAFGTGAALERCARELTGGHAVLLAAPSALGGWAAALERHAAELGVPVAAVDHTGGALAAAEVAAGMGRAARVVATVRPAHAASHAERLVAAAERPRHGAPFGAGVLPAAVPATTCLKLVARRAWVGPEEDPERAAARVARRAFGADVAAGFLVDALAAVDVHPRVFSAFHGALLARLDDDRDVLACGLYAPFRRAHERVHRLALDEGATLVHSARAPGSPAEARRPVLVRSVFTNVDPGTRLARELEPAGILRILRAEAPQPDDDPRPRSPA